VFGDFIYFPTKSTFLENQQYVYIVNGLDPDGVYCIQIIIQDNKASVSQAFLDKEALAEYRKTNAKNWIKYSHSIIPTLFKKL
jgi:hypothetical protein